MGFVHGVMNTDNTALSGETLDYGPYGFLTSYRDDYVINHTDHMAVMPTVSSPV